MRSDILLLSLQPAFSLVKREICNPRILFCDAATVEYTVYSRRISRQSLSYRRLKLSLKKEYRFEKNFEK